MREQFNTETRARLRTLLAMGYALFIVYASLSPFVGWRELGLNFTDVLRAPLRLTYTHFDATANMLAYLPFGLLVSLALRRNFGLVTSLLAGCTTGIVLSVGMEYLQMYLPTRISSNMDILSNSIGAFLGAILAVSIASWTHLSSRIERWRSHVFHHGKEMDYGLALLALWMFGQINPSLPMLGNVFIGELARQPFATLPVEPFDGWEAFAVALNLLMIGTLMLTLLRIPHKVISALLVVLSVVAAIKFFTAAVLLKSWALLLWINSEAVLGVLLGMVALFVMLRWSRNTIIKSGAAITLSYLVIINFVFGNNSPAAAKTIYQWHYVHLLNYNGLAQTIAFIFPALLLLHLWKMRKLPFH
ncbi:MAG: VanZ family protein [Pseudomonadota bacterium]|jgi:VanZ family protein